MNYMSNKTVCADCYDCADVIIHVVSVTIFACFRELYVK